MQHPGLCLELVLALSPSFSLYLSYRLFYYHGDPFLSYPVPVPVPLRHYRVHYLHQLAHRLYRYRRRSGMMQSEYQLKICEY